MDDKNVELVAQMDYVYPFSEDSRLDTGFRSTFERLDEDSRFFEQNNTNSVVRLLPCANLTS